jgi:hypothetical protein
MYESNQEVFNTVADHLIRQGRKAIHGTDEYGRISQRCRYRAHDGTKCAIGVLIPDDLYHPNLEGRGVWRLLKDASEGLPLSPLFGPEVCHGLLMSLQDIHDCVTVCEWPRMLRALAKELSLQLPPCLAETAPSERPAVPVTA